MTARTSKKPTKGNGTKPPKDTTHANGSATALVTTDKANGQRKPYVPYSDEIGDIICERLCDGESLNSICSSDDMPNERSVRLWAADPSHPFSPKYVRAREVGWLKVADEVLAIADGLEAGKHDPGVVQRDRLKFDARRWLLSKVLPKIYGDRLEVDAEAGLVVVETPAAIKALLEALPDLGVLSLNGSAVPAISSDVEERS